MRNPLVVPFVLSIVSAAISADEFKQPLFQVVDLDIGGSTEITLFDGSKASLKVLDLDEVRDKVCFSRPFVRRS